MDLSTAAAAAVVCCCCLQRPLLLLAQPVETSLPWRSCCHRCCAAAAAATLAAACDAAVTDAGGVGWYCCCSYCCLCFRCCMAAHRSVTLKQQAVQRDHRVVPGLQLAQLELHCKDTRAAVSPARGMHSICNLSTPQRTHRWECRPASGLFPAHTGLA